jgi:hypothetical protein
MIEIEILTIAAGASKRDSLTTATIQYLMAHPIINGVLTHIEIVRAIDVYRRENFMLRLALAFRARHINHLASRLVNHLLSSAIRHWDTPISVYYI